MAQERKLVFGALIETEDLPTDIANIMAPGRLRGMVFSVAAADLLKISPGSCLLPDGIIILEDENRELLINNTSFPAEYTVIYQLEDTRVLGGSPALLRLLPGILKQEDFTDSCVLGWIKYPGGSVPLPDSAFVQPKSVRVEPIPGTVAKSYLPPFAEAIKPPQERPGGIAMRTVRVANLSSAFSQVMSFGGVPARLLSATVTTDSVTIPASLTDYDTFALKKVFAITGITTIGNNTISNVSDMSQITLGQFLTGTGIPVGSTVTSVGTTSFTMTGLATASTPISSTTLISVSETLYSYSTVTSAQGALTAGIPKALIRTPFLATNKFVINPTDTLRIDATVNGSPVAAAGEINVAVEAPASTGNWREQIQTFGAEFAQQFLNISPTTLTYNFKLPFMITGEGQPKKLVTRLNVDFNTIVTLKVKVGTTTITLDPVSGTVANTGGLVTREFTIPTLTSLTWIPGNTALIDVSIQAQPGGSAAFAYISLSFDNAPFLLFV